MDILVTGASGFVGSHLVPELLRRGHSVTAFIRPISDTKRLPATGVRVVAGDVTDLSSLVHAFPGHDAVIHLAAVVGKNPGGWGNHERVGVLGTRNVIDAAAATNVTRFVHLSSFAVYAPSPSGVATKEDWPLENQPESWNHYVRQKVMSEKIVWQAHHAGRIRATVLRPPTILGPGDPNLVPQIQAIMNSPLGAIADDGRNRIPVVVVEEFVTAVAEALDRESTSGRAYNVAGHQPVSKDALLGYFVRAGLLPARRPTVERLVAGIAITVARAQERPFGWVGWRDVSPTTALVIRAMENHARRRAQRDLVADCSRAVGELGWRGTADYRTAIQSTMNWFQSLRVESCKPIGRGPMEGR